MTPDAAHRNAPERKIEAAPDLTIVIPTFNERDNLARLVAKIDVALTGVRWHAIFVDDNSPDGTWREARRLAEADDRLTCIRRVKRRGLAGAVVEGAMASASPLIAVMDADLQHDERLLVPMLEVMRQDEADLVMASRALDLEGQSTGLSPFRRRLSRLANRACAWITKRDLIDPMSGFFMIRREEFDRLAPWLSSAGFKILFDILATARGDLRVKELTYSFSPRASGESKFDQRVVADYLSLAMSKITRDMVSPRAVMFALVGLNGLAIHLVVLRLSLSLGFGVAQLLAATAAMTCNYFLNNALTYRDRSHKGWKLLYGYIKFVAFCALGLAANVGAGSLGNSLGFPWWVSGIFGAMVGAVWNYLTTAAAVWT